MKRFLAVLAAGACFLAPVTSCSDNNEEFIAESEAVDPAVGNWKFDPSDLTGLSLPAVTYLRFDEDGGGSLYIDFTSVFFIDRKGTPVIRGNTLPNTFVDYDGRTLRLKIDTSKLNDTLKKLTGDDVSLLILDRVDEADKESMNGRYTVRDSGFLDTILGFDITGKRNYILIDNEDMGLLCHNIITYDKGGRTLEMYETPGIVKKIMGEDMQSGSYSIDGDTMTITSAGGKVIELKKQA